MPGTLPDLPTICALAFDALPQGVLITDSHEATNPIVYANPAFESMTGYEADAILGWNCRFLQGPATDRQEVARIREAVAAKRVYQGLLLNYRKDGAPFWNELTIGPIAGGQEPDRYLVGVQIDVSSRIALEERLREAQKMEAIGKLAGGIAHDFNNLLALILGNADVIAARIHEASPEREAAADIIEAALAGSELVKRLLDFARGQQRAPARVDAARVVQSVLGLVARGLRDGLHLKADLAPDTGAVEVDETLFETALINLVLNARDATSGCAGVVTVTTRRRAGAFPDGRDGIAVTVADTGAGMDAETARRAFEPYYSTKGPERGTGLGLSMVYSFAEQSGGRAVIASCPGAGTKVELLLPAAR